MKDTIKQVIEQDANSSVNKRESLKYIEGYLEGHNRGAKFIIEEHNQINKELLEALAILIREYLVAIKSMVHLY